MEILFKIHNKHYEKKSWELQEKLQTDCIGITIDVKLLLFFAKPRLNNEKLLNGKMTLI